MFVFSQVVLQIALDSVNHEYADELICTLQHAMCSVGLLRDKYGFVLADGTVDAGS